MRVKAEQLSSQIQRSFPVTSVVYGDEALLVEEAADMIRQQAKVHGIVVSSSVSSKTDFLIIGENVGQSKLKAAKVNDVVILTEEEYLDKLNKK